MKGMVPPRPLRAGLRSGVVRLRGRQPREIRVGGLFTALAQNVFVTDLGGGRDERSIRGSRKHEMIETAVVAFVEQDAGVGVRRLRIRSAASREQRLEKRLRRVGRIVLGRKQR